jgi:hypothetical protein
VRQLAAMEHAGPDGAGVRVSSQTINRWKRVLHAVVHGWYEGHIQGEDACPGCDYRGELPKQATRGWLNPDVN